MINAGNDSKYVALLYSSNLGFGVGLRKSSVSSISLSNITNAIPKLTASL